MGIRLPKVLLLSALILVTVAAKVIASYQPIRVQPSRFIFEGKPGDSITGSIRVTNGGTGDAQPKSALGDLWLSRSNEVVIEEAGRLPSSLDGWIKFNPRQFFLKPNDTQTVRFTVRIPTDAEPGERRGVILFEQVSDFDQQATGAEIKLQVASTIYVQVLPVTRGAQIVEVQVRNSGTQTAVLLDLKATGNAHFRGTGLFEFVAPGQSKPVASGDFGPLVVMPAGSCTFVAVWNGVLPSGKYQLNVTLRSDEPKSVPLKYSQDYVQP